MVRALLAVLVFPATSAKPPADTDKDAVPSAFAVGVNVAEYTVADEEANPDNDPPVTDTSPTTKSVDASDNVNVIVDVPPTAKDPEPDLDNDTVGAVESRVIVDVAADADAGPEFPATSATDDAFNRG